MSRTTTVTTSFTSGELSPRLLGRTDLKKYQSGVAEMQNFISQTHGGVSRRPGTQFIQEAYSPNVADIRLVEFQYSVDQTYILELGVTIAGGANGVSSSPDSHGYVRFYRLDGSGNPGILINTIPDPDVPTIKSGLPWVESELKGLQFTQSADVLYVFSPTRPILKIRRLSAADSDPASWDYLEHEHADGPYSNFNSDNDLGLSAAAIEGDAITVSATTISTGASATGTFTDNDIGRHIRLEDDVVPAEVAGFAPGTASPSDAESDTPAVITFTNTDRDLFGSDTAAEAEGTKVEFYKCVDGVTELDDLVFTVRNISLSGGGGTFELYNTDTSYADPFEGTPAYTGHIGYCRVEGQEWAGWGVITGVAGDGASCTVEIKSPFISTAVTTNWRLGAWSKETGYPKTGTFYQDRLWAASTTSQPQTLWSSETGGWSCFSPNTLDDGIVLATSAISVTLAEEQVNEINSIIGDTSGLIIMTSGGEWLGRGSTSQAAITPEDMLFQKQSSFGSHSTVKPLRAGSSIVFWQRDGEVCRELTYEFGKDRFIAPNITVLSEHLTDGGIIDSAAQVGKDTKLWFIKSGGTLVACTYERSQEVVAWHQHVLAPSDDGTAARVMSIATLRGTEQDMVWVAVERDIDGASKIFIELMQEETLSETLVEDVVYLDSSLKKTGGAAAIWSGFDHLIGEDIYALGDGDFFGPIEVAVDGSITLDVLVTKVIAGKKYESRIKTMPITPTSAKTEYRGKFRRVFKTFANLYRSKSGKSGTEDTVHGIEYPSSVTGLHTGVLTVNNPDNWGKESVVVIKSDSIYPLNILSIIFEMETGGV